MLISWARLNRRVVLLATVLIALIALSLVITVNWFSNQTSPREFYLGVEYAYGDRASELKSLVDKVKNYTNLFVIGSIQITFNQTALNESCDYISNAGLKILVLFTDSTKYSYSIFTWMTQSQTNVRWPVLRRLPLWWAWRRPAGKGSFEAC